MLPKPDSERPPLPAYASEGKALFHPHVRALFGKAFKLALAGQIFCIVAILICVNVLIGFSFNPNPYQKENMKIAIADADKGGIISLALRKVIDNAASFSLNYKFVDVDEDFGTLQNAVDVGTYTAAFYLYPGSSAALMAALMDPTKPFPNTGTFSYVYDEGRVGPAYNISLGGLGSNIASITTAFLKAGLVAKFGAMNVATNQINIPVLQSPIGVTTVNLHPVPTYGLHNAMGTAMMQLYLVGLINAIALAKVHSEMEGRGIEKNHLLLLNVFHRISSCFFLSLWPIFVVLITGCADTSVVTAKVFFVWWMMLWLGMTVYVAICTWAVRLFGPPMGFMFILVFLMLNVGSSAAAVPVDSLPDFFRLGYGMPFMNLVEASKAILVGSNESTLSRSIGVHFAWIGLIVVVLLVIYNDVIGRLKEWVFSYKMNSREEFAAAIRYQLFPDRDVLAAGKVPSATHIPHTEAHTHNTKHTHSATILHHHPHSLESIPRPSSPTLSHPLHPHPTPPLPSPHPTARKEAYERQNSARRYAPGRPRGARRGRGPSGGPTHSGRGGAHEGGRCDRQCTLDRAAAEGGSERHGGGCGVVHAM